MDENFDINTENDVISDSAYDTENRENTSQKEDKKDENGKTEIVGIRFKKTGKTYYFAPGGFVLKQDQPVIVDTSRGQEYGYTAVTNREVRNSELSEPLRSVIRLATDEDTKIHTENRKKETDAYNACIALIDKHKLEMKLIDTELSFDRTKMLFYFSAEGRVDFRELVKDLASTFHTRIEMRQIGIRDEAKILGGLGICGRPYCCSTFLTDFGQVSVKMAKEQNLSINSAKISGSCGRLMCCLRYEYDTYLAEKALTPKVDSRVVTPSGAGVVTAANPLAGIVKVRLDSAGEDGESIVFVREDVVKESEYSGQTLTKTELPKRGRKDDDMPIFGELPQEMPTAVIKGEEKQEKDTEAVPQSSPANGETQNNHHHKNHRNRHKKHKKGNNGQPQGQGGQNQPQNQHKPPQQNGQNANKQPQNAQNGQQAPHGGEGSSHHKKKKKFFKHYNRNGGNAKGAGGENK